MPKATTKPKNDPSAGDAVGAEIQILELKRGALDVCILGTSPLICNRMSAKVWHELLAPRGRKTTVEKQSNMKHDPIQEFRDSPYIVEDDSAGALIGLMASGFKKAMGTAAMHTGAKRTEIGRLVYVPGELVEIYGLPKIFLSITRSADMARTPDVRTRAILPEWACRLSIEYTTPQLREQGIANLLAAAGFISGVGDWRQEKGSGSFGSFRLCSPDDPDFVRILKTQGREQQREAMRNPQPYNDETSEVLAWFGVEMTRRGFRPTGFDHVQVPKEDPAAVPAGARGKRAKAANGHAAEATA